MRTILRKTSFVAIAFSAMALQTVTAGKAMAEDVTLGVLAPRGALAAKKQWTNFSGYLSEKTGLTFKLKPLSAPDTMAAATNKSVDYILTNPVIVAKILKTTKSENLASLNKAAGDKFGGVIIAKADSGIKTSADVKGKKVMGLKKLAAGGYLFQAYHLKENGVNVDADATVLPAAKKQDDIVMAVDRGIADVGFVRTGVLENMAKEGKVSLDNFSIIDEASTAGFTLKHTTTLYPEWQFLAVEGTKGIEHKDTVAAALKGVEEGNGAIKSAKAKGFKDAQSMDNLVAMLTAMKVAPFGE